MTISISPAPCGAIAAVSLAGRAICERLQSYGHEVLTTHLLADNVETAESQITERDVFRRDLAWLTACDVLVAEASGSSYGVGFEVGYVLGRAKASGQRVVLLYDRARRDKVSRLITGNDDRRMRDVRIRIGRGTAPTSSIERFR